jgi:hypothetical protein
LSCVPAGSTWGEYDLYLGTWCYYIRVGYVANGRQVEAEFQWGSPKEKGDTIALRYDPGNPECNNRTVTLPSECVSLSGSVLRD